ncbi:MAG TPA: ABC transporter permease subunit [Nocardioidaceae bacterium]|nr:ABC transporter permease subunit [Nocardioidaceae bacterium]
MSSVLFDTPGPRARTRHRIGTVIGVIAIAGVLALVGWKLWIEEAITPDKWSFLTVPAIVTGLGEALLVTLWAAAVAIVLAVVFGAVFAAGRLSNRAVVRWPCVVVVEFFRAVPLLLLIFFLFIAYGSTLGAFGALVIALMLYNGSVLAEIFRAGILAVPKGQSEAAYSIGMRKRQVMTTILAPQAVRSMLPAIVSQCVVALKDTALGFTIGYSGIVHEGEFIFISPVYNNPIAVGIVLAVVFIVINYSLSRLATYLESRLRRRGASAVRVVGGPDQSGAAV